MDIHVHYELNAEARRVIFQSRERFLEQGHFHQHFICNTQRISAREKSQRPLLPDILKITF